MLIQPVQLSEMLSTKQGSKTDSKSLIHDKEFEELKTLSCEDVLDFQVIQQKKNKDEKKKLLILNFKIIILFYFN